MRAVVGVVLVLLAAPLAGCVDAPPAGGGRAAPELTFHVRVQDGVTGGALSDAEVLAILSLMGPCGPQIAWRQWRPVDVGDGRFELTVPAPSGDDTVVVFSANVSGYEPGEGRVARGDVTGPDAWVNLSLRPLGELEVPAGPGVGLHDLSGDVPPRVLDPGVHVLPAGRYSWGRDGGHGAVEVPAHGRAVLPAVEGNASDALEGVVRVGGVPQAGVRVFLGPPGGAEVALREMSAAARSDAQGRFSLPWAPANATLVAWVPGERADAGSLRVVAVDASAASVEVEAEAPRC